jgi:hypothetical protein
MEVKFELTAEDLALCRKETAKKTPGFLLHLWGFILVYLLFILADILLSMLLTVSQTTSLGLNLLIRSLVGIGLLLFVIFVSNSVARRAAAKISAIDAPNGLFCEHTFAIDESGFTETTHVNKNFGAWAGVERVDETDNFVVITVRLCCTHFIPKRAFASSDEIRTFIKTVRNHISPGSDDKLSTAAVDY